MDVSQPLSYLGVIRVLPDPVFEVSTEVLKLGQPHRHGPHDARFQPEWSADPCGQRLL